MDDDLTQTNNKTSTKVIEEHIEVIEVERSSSTTTEALDTILISSDQLAIGALSPEDEVACVSAGAETSEKCQSYCCRSSGNNINHSVYDSLFQVTLLS